LPVYHVANNAPESHLYTPIEIIDYAVELDARALLQRQESNQLLKPFGLDFELPPKEKFRAVAQQLSGVSACRFANTHFMMRIFWCNIANRHVNVILDGTSDRDEAARKAWIDLQNALERISRREADLLLACLPFYISGTDKLSATTVSPLVWPLSIMGTCLQLSSVQRDCAKNALLQIGERAMIPLATKLAETQFHPNAKVTEEAHMLHQAWHL
jgi:hypothetical protein